MSVRISSGGSWINRSKPIQFYFNKKKFQGFEGDSVASALLANGQQIIGRSFKYHRPRGFISSGVEEPNGLFSIDYQGEFVPNLVGTMIQLQDGMKVYSQNHWPSLEMDFGSVLNKLSRFIPAGFYYKTFIDPKRAWETIYEPAIRRSAGLGQASRKLSSSTFEQFNVHIDILIIGGGFAGILAAKLLAKSNKSILLVEQSQKLGGQYLVDLDVTENGQAKEKIHEISNEIAQQSNISVKTNTTLTGAYDHDYYLAEESLPYNSKGPSKRFWKIRAKKVLLATGAIERPLCFAGNDLPGVQLASGVRNYLSRYGVSSGDRTVLLTNNDEGYRTALALWNAGLNVSALLDVRRSVKSSLYEKVDHLGVEIILNRGIGKVQGEKGIKSIDICSQAGEGNKIRSIDCDSIAMSGGISPVVHIWSHCGGKLLWNEEKDMFIPDWKHPPINANGEQRIFPIGLANGELLNKEMLVQLKQVLLNNFEIQNVSFDDWIESLEGGPWQPIQNAWLVPHGMKKENRSKTWVDFQNDVKVSDLNLAIQEGYKSIEHTKRYTTLGMATDQGKTSNVNGLAIVSKELSIPIERVGTTTFRPPYTPVMLGSISGQARGELFKPVRKTQLDAWHDENSAVWEPVGDWRRPYCYLQDGESIESAVNREALRVRTSVGILDASTLGKIIVKGRDAGEFLDLIYTNVMSSLKIEKCRYGLMCDENGFLVDDGVVARLDDQTFLCHTTTGGADTIFAWMEEWLQCEWWNMDVFVSNVTEEYCQIAIAGKESRSLLEKIGGMKLDSSTLPFMSWQEGKLGAFNVRLFRISFSGELAFEVSIKAKDGLKLWQILLEEGKEFSIEPYGTEALHVLRAEKGFIMIGDETDGTVIPQDLGLEWAVSKKKKDFIGKRGQQREYLSDPNRWQFVGLEVEENSPKLPHGVYAHNDNLSGYGFPEMEGRVTSSYYSPILKRPIALGLVKNGTNRMGELIKFNCSGKLRKAKIVNPEFYNPSRSLMYG